MNKRSANLGRITAAQRRDRSDRIVRYFREGKTRAEISQALRINYQTVCRTISARDVRSAISGETNDSEVLVSKIPASNEVESDSQILTRILDAYEAQSRQPSQKRLVEVNSFWGPAEESGTQIKMLVSFLKRWGVKSARPLKTGSVLNAENPIAPTGKSEALNAWLEKVKAGNAVIERANLILNVFAEAGIALHENSIPEIVRDLKRQQKESSSDPDIEAKSKKAKRKSRNPVLAGDS